MHITSNRLISLACAVLIVTAGASDLHAQSQMPRSVVASGCVNAAGNSHRIHGSIGQAVIGNAKSNAHAGFFGFWYNGDNATVAVEALHTVAAPSFELVGIYPQPARDQLSCQLSLPERGACRISIHGLLGRQIYRGSSRMLGAGTHRVHVQLPDLPSGIYLVHASWKEQTRTAPVTVLR